MNIFIMKIQVILCMQFMNIIYTYNVIYDLANLAIQYSKSHRRSLKIGIVGFAFTHSNSI